jgi:precorrin-2/cobalt-factor-2 C20-methyltransferase
VRVDGRGDERTDPVVPAGRLFGLGVGPGDPELITLKALRILQACPVVVSFSAVNRVSNARRVISGYLRPEQEEVALVYPITTEAVPEGRTYETLLIDFYDAAAAHLGAVLDGGRDVAVVCEGDPFFYGSFMYLHNRLGHRYRSEVVPGVASIVAGAAALGAPLVCLDETLSILSGTLPAAELEARLRQSEAAVIMKLGRNLAKVRAAVERAGLLDRAHYVERVTMAEERLLPLKDADAARAPYFSMVVIPSATAPAR